jgi:hypothetical protein
LAYNSRQIEKYLQHYAEPETQAFDLDAPAEFHSILVIPVYDESFDQLVDFLHYTYHSPSLLIWVFNAPEPEEGAIDPHSQAALVRTRGVLEKVCQHVNAVNHGDYLQADVKDNLSLYIIDRCQPGCLIPRKQGVGLARKLGMDLALRLSLIQYRQCSRAVEWIHSCDADVSLPESYFDISAGDPGVAVALYPFEHLPQEGYEQAMHLYDYALRYYVNQLAKAGSPYAFHTIGSLIVVKPSAYAAVRGIPKRSGAEDFYFLNKLAKVGSVMNLDAPCLSIAGRPSQRVPFGTGPAISKIRDMACPAEDYRFYNPKCFAALKILLSIIAETGQTFATVELLFSRIRDMMSLEESAAVIDALIVMKIEKQFVHLSQKKEGESFRRAFHTWFDAFVTLRFIHLLRDAIYPNVSYAEVQAHINSPT